MAHPQISNHICMLDGPDYPNPTAKAGHDEVLKENERLKALLLKNGISWFPANPKESTRVHKMKTRKRSAASQKELPHLPMEIQLRILGFAMRCSFPVIDPFTKLRPEHLTKDEREKRKELPVQILATSKAYHEEGSKFFFNNSFVFTQVAALENFGLVSREFRSTIKHVALRVIGKYYDDEPTKRNILSNDYHPALRDFKSPIYGRPNGAEMDRGVHAYCWQQFADFMMKLQLPSKSHRLSKLFPSLRRMQVDLVNFCEHLHYPGSSFAAVLRWHTGPFLDELIVTGLPGDDPEQGPEQAFNRILKDEGVWGSGCPIFVSHGKFLKSLPPLGLAVSVVRADDEYKIIREFQNKDKNLRKRIRASLDPEDGKPPKSYYPSGRTLWRFTRDSLSDSTRKWIEFDRQSGCPAHDVDMWSDIDEEMYDSEGNLLDSDGNPLDSDGNPLDSDDDMDDGSGDDMPALLAA